VESATLLYTPRAARARGGIMEIKVLGTGCANCKRLYAEAEKAVARSGRTATITKVEAMDEIVAHGILRTPGLVIDGKVVSSGRVPSAAEIETMIANAAAKP
jgi:small redox-active disulfide protein 2